jgi:hypothetical protein
MKKPFSTIWEELGRKSFARFFKLSMEEVKQMESSPNDVFYEMLEEMGYSLRKYENYMVKIRDPGHCKKLRSRLEILDI